MCFNERTIGSRSRRQLIEALPETATASQQVSNDELAAARQGNQLQGLGQRTQYFVVKVSSRRHSDLRSEMRVAKWPVVRRRVRQGARRHAGHHAVARTCQRRGSHCPGDHLRIRQTSGSRRKDGVVTHACLLVLDGSSGEPAGHRTGCRDHRAPSIQVGLSCTALHAARGPIALSTVWRYQL